MTQLRDTILELNGEKFREGDKTTTGRPQVEDEYTSHVAKRLLEMESTKGLDAPEVFAEESFPDANIVAEYLDGTLDDPGLAREYEQACLEDPVLLAELSDTIKILHDLSAKHNLCPPRHCRHRLYYIQHVPEVAADSSDAPVCILRKEEPTSETGDSVSGQVDCEVLSDPETLESAPHATAHSPRARFDWKILRERLYRALIMISLIGIMVLFFRLPPERREESLSRLRNVWTIFSSKNDPVEERAITNLPSSELEQKSDSLDQGKKDATHGDFPLRSSLGRNEAVPEREVNPLSATPDRISSQPSFVIPTGGDSFQSGPELLR